MEKLTKTPILVILIILIAGQGCINLGSRAPRTRYYILTGQWIQNNSAPVPNSSGLSIGFRQLDLASYLKTPLIVIRRGPHEISFSEFNRWGGDLDKAINRTVAGYLVTRTPIGRVDIVPWPPQTRHDYLIQIRVLRFEGIALGTTPTQDPTPGTLFAPEGQVHVLATWEIVNPEDGQVLSSGTTDFLRENWNVGDYDQLISLFDAGLTELAADLAENLRTLQIP